MTVYVIEYIFVTVQTMLKCVLLYFMGILNLRNLKLLSHCKLYSAQKRPPFC